MEHYESQEDTHWKKLIQVDGHDRKLWFYHHRNKDGLIYRHEQIGYKDPARPWEWENERETNGRIVGKNKILEKFKNRPDHLIYHSVVFDTSEPESQSLKLFERNYNKECVIKKMTQKFELDEDSLKPPGEQVRKTLFDLKDPKGEITLFYHYQKGKITATSVPKVRADLIGNANAKMDTVGEKEDTETKEMQTNKQIVEMEQNCHSTIKESEARSTEEVKQKEQIEKYIQQQRVSSNQEEIFDKILQKSIQEKARDKMKQGKKKEDSINEEKKTDYLAHILKNLGFEDGAQLEEEACIAVKNEALRSLKDRLLTRAEIIQRRLDEEAKNLDLAYVSNSNLVTVGRAS